MRSLYIYLLANILFLNNAFSVVKVDTSFTNDDMWALSKKITMSLRKCKPLRSRPQIIVEIENSTTESVDKVQFSETIHSLLEGATHASPATNEPEYEIRTKLEFQKPGGASPRRPSYTLTARVFQANEKICEEKAKILKGAHAE